MHLIHSSSSLRRWSGKCSPLREMRTFFENLIYNWWGAKKESGLSSATKVYASSISSDSISLNPLNTMSLGWLSPSDGHMGEPSVHLTLQYLSLMGWTTVPPCKELLMNQNFITVVWISSFYLAVWFSAVLVFYCWKTCVAMYAKSNQNSIHHSERGRDDFSVHLISWESIHDTK